MVTRTEKTIWALLRLMVGWIFLWPFLDKLFGLGINTAKENAWINGASPTLGFLTHATKGPFASFFNNLAGQGWVDWLFMIGIFLVGCALIIGIGLRIASVSGILLLMFMWLAVLPPAHNPFIDDHIIYSVLLFSFPFVKAGDYFGLGNKWRDTILVKRFRFLE